MAGTHQASVPADLPASMVAGVHAPQGFTVKEVPVPVVPPDGLLVKISATTICGSDLKTWRGQHVKLAGNELRSIPMPRIMGHEIAGTVVAVDPSVSGYQPGDTVSVACVVPCGACRPCRRGWFAMCDEVEIFGWDLDGGFAGYMAVPEHAVRIGCVNHVDSRVEPTGAAVTEPLSCAVNAQQLGAIGPGDTVVVIGAGAIGCLNAELARIRGADQVIVVQRSRRRLEKARIAGADHYISSEDEDPVERVLELTGGHGADVVLVCASSGTAQQQAVEMASKRARVNVFAGLARGTPAPEVDTNLIHYREMTFYGAHGSSPADHALAARMISDGRIDTSKYVDATFPLAEIASAIEAAQSNEYFKVAVIP